VTTVYRVFQQAAPSTLTDLARDEFRYGAKILYADGPPPVHPVEVDGTVIHSTIHDAAYFLGTSNPLLDHLGAFQRIEHDKHLEAELVRAAAPEAFAGTERVSDVWPISTGRPDPTRLREIEAEMHARYPRGFVLKPISSFATDGKFPSDRTPFAPLHAAYLDEAKPVAEQLSVDGTDATDAHLRLNQLPSYPGRVLDDVLVAPEKVIIQERLDIATDDGVIDEYRVHVVSGRVLAGGTQHRWDNYRALTPARIRQAEALVASVISRLPAPFDRLTYGVDVVRLTDDSFRIMELNPGWESQYFYAEYDVWVANLLAEHYAGEPTPLLAKFRRFEQARSIATKLTQLHELLDHRALRDAEPASLTELQARAAHALVAALEGTPRGEQVRVLGAMNTYDLARFLSRPELARLRRSYCEISVSEPAPRAQTRSY
jgi:hypothetical protein